MPNPLLFFRRAQVDCQPPLFQTSTSETRSLPFLPPIIKILLSTAAQPNLERGDFK